MTARSVSMGAPFRWLMQALDVGRKNPRALFGGFALLMVVVLLPSVLQMAIELALKPSMDVKLMLLAAATIVGMLVSPPVIAGALRLVHACESGQAAQATDVLAPYRDGPTVIRLILLSLLMLGVNALIFGALLTLPAGEFFRQVFMLSLTTPPGTQPDMSGIEVPGGVLLWMLAAMFALMVTGFGHMFAFCQASLAGRGPVGAWTDGLLATIRNLLPLIGFTLAAMVVGFVAMLLVGVVLVLVVAMASMLSPALGIALMIPLYIGLMLVMYVVMFSFFYHGWREIFGEPVLVLPTDSLAA